MTDSHEQMVFVADLDPQDVRRCLVDRQVVREMHEDGIRERRVTIVHYIDGVTKAADVERAFRTDGDLKIDRDGNIIPSELRWSSLFDERMMAAARREAVSPIVLAIPPRRGKTAYLAALEAHRRVHHPERPPLRAPLSVSEMVDRINAKIAASCAIPLRILDPIAWRAKRRAQRATRKARRRRKARRGW